MEGRLRSSLTKSRNRVSKSMTVGSNPRWRRRAARVSTPSWAPVVEWAPAVRSGSMKSATVRAVMRQMDRLAFTPSGHVLTTFASDDFVLGLRTDVDHHQLGLGDRGRLLAAHRFDKLLLETFLQFASLFPGETEF